jgi:DNA polymerase elongation subunit (family B)
MKYNKPYGYKKSSSKFETTENERKLKIPRTNFVPGRLVVDITSQLLSPSKGPHYTLNRRLVKPRIWHGFLREAKYPSHFLDFHPGLSTS